MTFDEAMKAAHTVHGIERVKEKERSAGMERRQKLQHGINEIDGKLLSLHEKIRELEDEINNIYDDIDALDEQRDVLSDELLGEDDGNTED